MARVAVLVDLGFFLPRYRSLIQMDSDPPHTPKKVARNLWHTALRHVHKGLGEQLYRILVYDCVPLSKKVHSPITGRAIDFSKVPTYQFRKALHHELVCLRKVALRLGELSDRRQWLLRAETTRRLLKREITVQDLTEDDVTYDATQKGVDIKFGIDIASLAYKRLVEKVVLITGDSDFVPAAKLARREGLDVVLDPLWNHITPSLHEHIDGLRSVWPKPGHRAPGAPDQDQKSPKSKPPAVTAAVEMCSTLDAASRC
jgi:uncharacterized LabA/DUF88 family protein